MPLSSPGDLSKSGIEPTSPALAGRFFTTEISGKPVHIDTMPPTGLSLDTFLGVSAAAAAAKSLQSCPTLCDLIDGTPPGSPVPRILQARTLAWVSITLGISSRGQYQGSAGKEHAC